MIRVRNCRGDVLIVALIPGGADTERCRKDAIEISDLLEPA
jgi:hypothetical protein